MTLASAPSQHGAAPPAFARHVVVFAGLLSCVRRRDARVVVRSLGGETADDLTPRTTMLVIGAGGGRPARTKTVAQAESINARAPGRIQMVSEEEFCRLSQLPSAEALQARYHSLGRLGDIYHRVRETELRCLEKWGLIRPVVHTHRDTFVGFSDVALIKKVHDAMERGSSFHAAVRQQLADHQGQLTLNFGSVRSDVRPAKVVALRRREATKVTAPVDATGKRDAQSVLAARFFVEGADLDEGSEVDRGRARIAYRKSLLLDPNLVPAIVNLGNLHYGSDDLVEAQALYLRAVMLAADCFEAHFNLGNIYHDLSRFPEAIAYYSDALRLNPQYADAHFYLAVTLEKIGSSDDAKTHWRRYQELAPDGKWVDLAREFSD